MGVTTSHYGKLTKAEFQGQKYQVECGYAKFVAKTKTVSIKTNLKTVRFLKTTWRTGAPMKSSGLVAACTGTVKSGYLTFSRATASKLSGAYFWYSVVGY